MFSSKKIITILVLTAFTLQSCAKGVTPTKFNASSSNENTNLAQLSDLLCAKEGDKDSDGDGICDLDDVKDDGTDCSQQAEGCLGDGDDGSHKKNKNKIWLYVTGAALAIGTGATIAGKVSRGHWWWKGNGSTDDAQLVKIANNNKPVKIESEEHFYTSGASVIGEIKTNSEIGKMIWNLTYIGGEAVSRGDTIKTCTRGAIGIQYKGASSGVAGLPYETDVTFTFDSDYANFGRASMSEANFNTLCKSKNGQYVAYQRNNGEYYVAPILTDNLNKITMTYVFSALPDATGSNVEGMTYKRFEPQHVGNDLYSSLLHTVTNFDKTTFNSTTDLNLRFKYILGNAGNKTDTAIVTAVEQAKEQEIQEEKISDSDVFDESQYF